MRTPHLLRKSLALLQREPKFFIPKLTETLFSSAYFAYFIHYMNSIALSIYSTGSAGVPVSPEELGNVLAPHVPMVAALLLAGLAFQFLDVLIFAMYPGMVSDYRSGKKISLAKSFRGALVRLFPLALVAIAAVILAIPAFLVAGMAIGLMEALNSAVPLYAAIFAILGLALAIAVIFFFAVPVVMLERRGFFSSMRRSVTLGLDHLGDIVGVFVVVVAMVALLTLADLLLRVDTLSGLLALAAYLALRAARAMASTYAGVLGPGLYLDVK